MDITLMDFIQTRKCQLFEEEKELRKKGDEHGADLCSHVLWELQCITNNYQERVSQNSPNENGALPIQHVVRSYFMEARDFYDKRIKEEPTIGSVQLMEEYAKHIIEINFCDGSPIDFEKLSVDQLKKIHNNVNKCVDWVNS
jgi:hypothetical protein